MVSIGMAMGGVEKTALVDPGFGVEIEVTFDPTSIPANLNAIEAQSARELAETLCQVVHAWQLEGPVPFSDIGKLKAGELVPDGAPIPFDPDIVEKLPHALLNGMLLGLVVATFPKSLTQTPESQETPPASPALGPIGTSTPSS